MLCMAAGTRRRAAKRLSNRGPGNQTGSAEPGAASRPAPPRPPREESGCARGAGRASGLAPRRQSGSARPAPKLVFCVTRPQKHSRSFSISRLFIYFGVPSASLAPTGRAGCFLLSGGILVAHRGSCCTAVPQAARLLRGKELFGSLNWRAKICLPLDAAVLYFPWVSDG